MPIESNVLSGTSVITLWKCLELISGDQLTFSDLGLAKHFRELRLDSDFTNLLDNNGKGSWSSVPEPPPKFEKEGLNTLEFSWRTGRKTLEKEEVWSGKLTFKLLEMFSDIMRQQKRTEKSKKVRI